MLQFLDFYADWCGPCKVMNPVIEELEKDFAGKMEISKIDVDNETEQTEKFGVMSIPTYVLLKDGQEVERFIGAQPKEIIVGKIQQHLS
jgi:thioredoxin 1